MDSIRSLHALARAWLLEGPLSSNVDAFQALLGRGRYAEGSIDKALRALAHFAHCMPRCRLSADQIDEALVEQFLDSHLARCDCHATALRTHGDLRAGLAHLLVSLREQQVILEPPRPSGPIAEELYRYNAHMRDARGQGIGTRDGRLAMVGRLLLCKFAGRPIAIGELQPEDVRGSIATELTRENSVSHASALAAALRAYFGYRATCGDALQALLGVISSPARCSLASLPRALAPEEVQRLPDGIRARKKTAPFHGARERRARVSSTASADPARIAADDSHSADEAAHAPWRAGGRHAAPLGRVRRR